MNFLTAYFKKQEGKRAYRELLTEALGNYDLSTQEKQNLYALCREYSLTDTDVAGINVKEYERVFNVLSRDERISDETMETLNTLGKQLNFLPNDYQYHGMQNRFTKYRSLYMLDNNILPVVTNFSQRGIDFQLKVGEKIHCSLNAAYMKSRVVSRNIQYRGPRYSLRLARGLSYRMGSYHVTSQSQTALMPEDYGSFWITSERAIFKGTKKSFEIKYTSMLSVDADRNGLCIFKKGRENPYLIRLGEYEIPLRVMRLLLK